ncbi:MAG: hypothetical protein K8L97_09815 [Anaerolineae bacterium]|nr:hypothetical protein [Anaerolineae bacterium]
MSDLVTLHFIGGRRRDFTVASPLDTERTWYVEIGQPIHVPPEDAAAIIQRDPKLWALDKGEPGGTPAETPVVEEAPAGRRKSKGD